jgi:hypothetical protein
MHLRAWERKQSIEGRGGFGEKRWVLGWRAHLRVCYEAERCGRGGGKKRASGVENCGRDVGYMLARWRGDIGRGRVGIAGVVGE